MFVAVGPLQCTQQHYGDYLTTLLARLLSCLLYALPAWRVLVSAGYTLVGLMPF